MAAGEKISDISATIYTKENLASQFSEFASVLSYHHCLK